MGGAQLAIRFGPGRQCDRRRQRPVEPDGGSADGHRHVLWRHRGDLFWYSLLGIVLVLVPFMLGEFYVGELGGVYVFAVAGVGMMLLAGYTGLISLGNAAFLGIGAYTEAILLGIPLVVATVFFFIVSVNAFSGSA